jgi:hypothetical protein
MIQILAPASPVALAQTRTPEGWRGWRSAGLLGQTEQ